MSNLQPNCLFFKSIFKLTMRRKKMSYFLVIKCFALWTVVIAWDFDTYMGDVTSGYDPLYILMMTLCIFKIFF